MPVDSIDPLRFSKPSPLPFKAMLFSSAEKNGNKDGATGIEPLSTHGSADVFHANGGNNGNGVSPAGVLHAERSIVESPNGDSATARVSNGKPSPSAGKFPLVPKEMIDYLGLILLGLNEDYNNASYLGDPVSISTEMQYNHKTYYEGETGMEERRGKALKITFTPNTEGLAYRLNGSENETRQTKRLHPPEYNLDPPFDPNDNYASCDTTLPGDLPDTPVRLKKLDGTLKTFDPEDLTYDKCLDFGFRLRKEDLYIINEIFQKPVDFVTLRNSHGDINRTIMQNLLKIGSPKPKKPDKSAPFPFAHKEGGFFVVREEDYISKDGKTPLDRYLEELAPYEQRLRVLAAIAMSIQAIENDNVKAAWIRFFTENPKPSHSAFSPNLGKGEISEKPMPEVVRAVAAKAFPTIKEQYLRDCLARELFISDEWAINSEVVDNFDKISKKGQWEIIESSLRKFIKDPSFTNMSKTRILGSKISSLSDDKRVQDSLRAWFDDHFYEGCIKYNVETYNWLMGKTDTMSRMSTARDSYKNMAIRETLAWFKRISNEEIRGRVHDYIPNEYKKTELAVKQIKKEDIKKLEDKLSKEPDYPKDKNAINLVNNPERWNNPEDFERNKYDFWAASAKTKWKVINKAMQYFIEDPSFANEQKIVEIEELIPKICESFKDTNERNIYQSQLDGWFNDKLCLGYLNRYLKELSQWESKTARVQPNRLMYDFIDNLNRAGPNVKKEALQLLQSEKYKNSPLVQELQEEIDNIRSREWTPEGIKTFKEELMAASPYRIAKKKKKLVQPDLLSQGKY